MLAMWTKATTGPQKDKGASMVEYALLVILIAIVALLAVASAGNEVSAMFSDIGAGFPG